MDIIDHAQQINELHCKISIANVLASITTGVAYTHCVECEDEIPEERRVALPGCRYCVECAAELEERHDGYR